MNNISHPPTGGNGTAVPAAMLAYPQYVMWRLVQKPGRPKPDKLPFNPATGGPAAVDDPSTWSDYATACAVFDRGGFDGIGFVITADDPFTFIDLDDCADPATGGWKPHAQILMNGLPGAWEVSQSRKGLHGIGYVSDKSKLANKRRKFADASGNRYECYTIGRFIAFRGAEWSGEIGLDWNPALTSWLPNAEQASDYPPVQWVDQPRPGYDGPSDDADLIKRAIASHPPLSSLGRKPPFAMLWNADPQLGQFYPDDGGQGRAFDHSSADLALMNGLAWWTGCNPARMERLYNRSALSRGDQRKTHLAIIKAIANPNRSYFSRSQRLRDDQLVGDDVTFAVLPEILSLDQAHREFVYISSGSQVGSRTNKTLRTYSDAVHQYAASKHPIDTGKIDVEGRPIIKSFPVIKLWLESGNRLSTDTITWAPGEPEFCRAPERQNIGDQAYNLWTPPRMLPAPANWQDWVKPFLHHVYYLIPIQAEQIRFLQWIAHIFQRPGELPHTCYLMIATETGIGRGTLASILTRTLRGYVAANMNIDALFGGFNGRISQKLLATVDEVREGNSANRYANAEALKSKITEETRVLNPKYGAQSVEKNCCRWLMFSNHMDALPFDNNDRRIIIIENPTQRARPDWYTHLHGLMNDQRFIASVQHYFTTLDISGFNPHEPAPINEAKRKALTALESNTAQACRDFIKQWPDELATRSDLVEFIGPEAPRGRALHHDIERAGMKTARYQKIDGRVETLLIVKGPLTPDDISATSTAVIANRIITARAHYRFTGGGQL